eukprot:14057882-Alexandrium_andersonii.AAC.1
MEGFSARAENCLIKTDWGLSGLIGAYYGRWGPVGWTGEARLPGLSAPVSYTHLTLPTICSV